MSFVKALRKFNKFNDYISGTRFIIIVYTTLNKLRQFMLCTYGETVQSRCAGSRWGEMLQINYLCLAKRDGTGKTGQELLNEIAALDCARPPSLVILCPEYTCNLIRDSVAAHLPAETQHKILYLPYTPDLPVQATATSTAIDVATVAATATTVKIVTATDIRLIELEMQPMAGNT